MGETNDQTLAKEMANQLNSLNLNNRAEESVDKDKLLDERENIFTEVRRLHRLVTCLAHQDELLTRSTMTGYASRLMEINEQLNMEDNESKGIFTKIKTINTQLLEEERFDATNNNRMPPVIPNFGSFQAAPVHVHSVANDPNIAVKPWDGTAIGFYQFEKRFKANYVQNSAYTDSNRFAAFQTLIGEKGRSIVGDLDDTREGLNMAIARIKERCGHVTHLRVDIERKLADLPPVKSKRDVVGLSALLNTAESSHRVLMQSGSNADYLENVFFKAIVLKLPYDMVDTFNGANNNSRNVDLLLKNLRDRIERSNYGNELHRLPILTATPRTRVHEVHSDPPVSASPRSTQPHPRNVVTRSTIQRTPQRSTSCRLCNADNHHVFQCNHGTVDERRQLALGKQLCLRCILNHPTGSCRSTYFCACGEQHSKIFCATNGLRPTPPQSPSTTRQQNTLPKTLLTPRVDPRQSGVSAITVSAGIHGSSTKGQHLKFSKPELLTAYVPNVVVNINGERVRMLLDICAGRTLIAEDLATRLNLPNYYGHDLNIGGYDGSTQKSERLVKATIKSLETKKSIDMILCVVPTITTRPYAPPEEMWTDLVNRGYKLSDCPENDRQPVGIIVGAEYYRKLFTGTDIVYTDEISLRHTIFGWTMHGFTEDDEENYWERCHDRQQKRRPPNIALISCLSPETCSHENSTKSTEPTTFNEAATSKPYFTGLDLSTINQPSSSSYSADRKLENDYLQEFIRTHVHYDRVSQRYSLNLPWLYPIDMEDNKKVALVRFHRLKRVLVTRNLTEDYHKAMNEMVTEYTEPADEVCNSVKCYYMPHHPVIRLDKDTTKLRVVNDASSHSPTSKSLNDNLYKGVVNWDLIKLLLLFRFGKYALTADIEKAFLRIQVEPEDRDAFRFWWMDENGNTVIRRFTVVPFGTSASPFLLFATLVHLFTTNSTTFSDVIPVLESRMYVDDLVAAFNDMSADQLEAFRLRTVELFKTAGMNIRKFRTNHPSLDASWADSASKATVSMLGHAWYLRTDMFGPSIDIDKFLSSVSLTKRSFTSFVQSVYNPTGIVAPFSLQLKFALQKLWKLKLKWDQHVPEPELKEGLALIQEARLVNEMRAPRNILPDDGSAPTLRIYCDASMKALGVVAYCCSLKGNFLLMAKSKLARKATIPELELDALVMAAALSNYLTSVYKFSSILICGDSKLNLQRLLQHPNKQKPAIGLRCDRIRRMASTATFRHVESKANMADLVSRGSSMTTLLANPQWLNAPDLSPDPQFESGVTSCVMTVDTGQPKCSCTRFSNYNLAINAYLHVARFVKRFTKQQRFSELHEQDLALVLLIRDVQRAHYLHEIAALESSDPDVKMDPDSILRNHIVFLDSLGQLRLFTRLRESPNFSRDHVSPVILPENCHFSRLVIARVHTLVHHPGVDRTCNSIRERYFIINQLKLVKQHITTCSICQRKRFQQTDVSHGQLPSFRTDIYQPPFTNTGVDLFGPLKVSMTEPGDYYGVIFVCATSRLVHIEIISNMTADSVFEAIRRFVARCGLPNLFYSDNGTQLVKLKNDLKEYITVINREHPDRELKFQWIHLTAHSPWRGGFYERLIKSIKDSLITFTIDRKLTPRRLDREKSGLAKPPTITRGNKSMTYEQLVTCMVEIEGLINNRPLFMHEGQVIRPIDFYGGRGSIQLPVVGNLPTDYRRPNIISDYKALQRRINTVRGLWKDQYLCRLRDLHQTKQVQRKAPKFEVGDVVHVKKPTKRLDKWPLGIITKVVVASDGNIRTVFVRTTKRGNIVTEAKDVRNLIPVECNHERHETEQPEAQSTSTDSGFPSTSTFIPTDSYQLRTRPARIPVGRRPKKAPIDQMLIQWKKKSQTQVKEAEQRKTLRARINKALISGKSKSDPLITDLLQQLYTCSSDTRCQSLSIPTVSTRFPPTTR